MIKLAIRFLLCLILSSLVLTAPSRPGVNQNNTNNVADDYKDEDDLLEQFLNGIKADLPVNSTQSTDDNLKLILISFDGFRWDYLENHTLPNINK